MTSPAHVPAPTGLPTITFYVDFVSPYAWLAFTQLPQALEGLHYQVRYRPVLLGALLQAHGNPGPAGVTPKRAWTLRHAAWAGQHLGVGLDMPARHPFPPLPLLRLALEHSSDGDINRFVTDTVLRHVWLGGGADALEPARLDALRAQLAPQRRADPEQAKQWLRANTDAAHAAGVFGVPTFEVNGLHFWGLDSLPMLRAYLEGDAWFGAHWQALADVPKGL